MDSKQLKKRGMSSFTPTKISTVKLIAIGDLHFQTSNKIQTDISTASILSTVSLHNPDLIVVLGDSLHKHSVIDMDPLNRLRLFLLELAKIASVYLLVGNHDLRNEHSALTDEHSLNVFKEFKDVFVCDKPRVVTYHHLKLVMCPFTPPGMFKQALNTLNSESFGWRDSHTIFAHQEFKGVQLGAKVSVDGDRWLKRYPLVVSGHIHHAHWLQSNIYYTGNSIQHTFAEEYNKSIASITYSGGKATIQTLPVEGIKKCLHTASVEEAEKWSPPEINSPNSNGDSVIWRLVVNDTPALVAAFKKSPHPTRLKKEGIQVKYQLVSPCSGCTQSDSSIDRLHIDVIDILSQKVADCGNTSLQEKFEILVSETSG